MRTFTYRVGTVVEIDGAEYRFVGKAPDGSWQLVNNSTRALIIHTELELDKLLSARRLVPEREGEPTRRQKRIKAVGAIEGALADLPAPEQARVRTRLTIILHVADKTAEGSRNTKITLNGKTTTPLMQAIENISAELGVDPICRATYYDWAGRYEKHGIDGLRGDMDRRGANRKLNDTVDRHLDKITCDVIVGQQSRKSERDANGKRKKVASLARQIEGNLQIQLDIENARHGTQLWLPSLATIYNRINEFPAELVNVARFGKENARKMHRGSAGQPMPKHSLALCEFDDTELDIFLICDFTGVVLGRAWLTWIIDVYSSMILGFDVSYEPPGSYSLVNTIRHSILPKAYIGEQYPDIEGTWPARGVFEHLAVDRAKAQLSRTADALQLDVGFTTKPLKRLSPFFKGSVENAFGNLNRMLLEHLNGSVVKSRFQLVDYDATKHATMTLSAFVAIFTAWIVDFYHCRPDEFSRLTVNERWNLGTKDYSPRLLADVRDLDMVFGIVIHDVRVDHQGIHYEKLRYYSDAIDLMRRQRGDVFYATIKANPANLARIHVYDPRIRAWLPAYPPLEFQAYCDGMTLHRHKINLKFANSRWGKAERAQLVRAHAAITESAAKWLRMNLGIGINKSIARYMGMGSNAFLQHLDIYGNYNPKSGAGPVATPSTSDNPSRPAESQPQASSDAPIQALTPTCSLPVSPTAIAPTKPVPTAPRQRSTHRQPVLEESGNATEGEQSPSPNSTDKPGRRAEIPRFKTRTLVR